MPVLVRGTKGFKLRVPGQAVPLRRSQSRHTALCTSWSLCNSQRSLEPKRSIATWFDHTHGHLPPTLGLYSETHLPHCSQPPSSGLYC